MTRLSKCETCRLRKIRCDEERPICGACNKKGRTCKYKAHAGGDSRFVHEQVGLSEQYDSFERSGSSAQESSRNATPDTTASSSTARHTSSVTLQLKRSRTVDNGQFLTFTQTAAADTETEIQARECVRAAKQSIVRTTLQQLSVPLAPTCQENGLASRWIYIVGPALLQVNPLGDWVRFVWDRAGSNKCLDLANEYALDSMMAFHTGDQATLDKASASGGRALQSLQRALQNHHIGSNTDDLIIAIMLHFATEHFRGIGTYYWVPHLIAASRLLAQYTTSVVGDEIFQKIACSTREDEITESILHGQTSLYENLPIPIPAPSTSQASQAESALREVDCLFVKLPRLVKLVRTAISDPLSEEKALEATGLANELFYSEREISITQTLAAQVTSTTLGLSQETEESPVSSSYHFETLASFVLATRYYLYRVLLCGLIQRLCDLECSYVHLDRTAAEDEDISAASSIAKCCDWAMKPDPSMPIKALKVLVPVQLAFGAWHRLEKRQRSTESLDYQRALRMKAWSIEIANRVDRMWRNTLTSYERHGGICEMFAGGPLEEWMWDYRVVRINTRVTKYTGLDKPP